MSDNSKKIAELNDAARKMQRNTGTVRIVVTPGVIALLQTDGPRVNALMSAVANFDTFTEDNDPYGEHDFGSFEFDGEKLYWKIDYYALDMKHGSEDPADIRKTVRVLTIMLASEY